MINHMYHRPGEIPHWRAKTGLGYAPKIAGESRPLSNMTVKLKLMEFMGVNLERQLVMTLEAKRIARVVERCRNAVGPRFTFMRSVRDETCRMNWRCLLMRSRRRR